MKIALQSFFIDYYDHWFDRRDEADEVWERRGDLPPYKQQAFQLMKWKGLNVPRHARADHLRDVTFKGEDPYVVAYYDPKLHATLGKRKLRLSNVKGEGTLCSEFIDTGTFYPTSTRIIHIGNHVIEFTMTSNHWWLSNRGDVEMELVRHGESKTYDSNTWKWTPEPRANWDVRHFRWPIYAIDYVDRKDGKRFAVDLNRCPEVRKTPVEDVFSPQACAYAIMDYFQTYNAEGKKRAKVS